MKPLKNFLNTTSKTKTKKIDEKDAQCINDILESSFIVILKTKAYKESSTFLKTIYRSKIDYDMIQDVLCIQFGYEYIGVKELKDIVHKYILRIEDLINYYRITNPIDRSTEINGRELFQKYKNIIYKKSNS